MYKINELERFVNGAKYFNKDYNELKNKGQYKQEYYLNTGLWWYRKHNEPIKIFTSCIASTDYLFKVIKRPINNVEIYYYKSAVEMDSLFNYYKNCDVKFVKIFKSPKEEFKHNTIVFAGEDTIIFDSKMLGIEKGNGIDRNVYRDKSKIDFERYYKRAKQLI